MSTGFRSHDVRCRQVVSNQMQGSSLKGAKNIEKISVNRVGVASFGALSNDMNGGYFFSDALEH